MMEIRVQRVFCRKFNSEQFLFQAFLISLIFFVAFIPTVNVLVRSSALKYFKNGNLWRHLAPHALLYDSFWNFRIKGQKYNKSSKCIIKHRCPLIRNAQSVFYQLCLLLLAPICCARISSTTPTPLPHRHFIPQQYLRFSRALTGSLLPGINFTRIR